MASTVQFFSLALTLLGGCYIINCEVFALCCVDKYSASVTSTKLWLEYNIKRMPFELTLRSLTNKNEPLTYLTKPD